jgi:IclR family acetate operon transcriptional repressor
MVVTKAPKGTRRGVDTALEAVDQGETAARNVIEESGSQTIAAVERAADILLYFTEVKAASVRITDISKDLGISKAGAHRVLASLRSRGLVTLDEETREYSLGPKALTLGLTTLARLDHRKVAAAELAALSAKTNETATLSIRAGDFRVYTDQVTPNVPVIMTVQIGVPFPLHAGASSKAMLAFLPQHEIDSLVSGTLSNLTPLTVTDGRKLIKELTEIRARGWAQSSGERQSGAASVASPIFSHEGLPIAVMSVCGPADRFLANEAKSVTALLEVTKRVSASLGYGSAHSLPA